MHKVCIGVTLIEVTISIAILTVMVTLSLGVLNYTTRYFVRAELENLYSLMLYIQRKALLEKSCYKLLLDHRSKKYSYPGHSYTLMHGVLFGVPPAVLGPPSHPEHIQKNPVTFSNNTIEFYPDGTISSGTVYITDKKWSCLYALTSGIAQVSYLRKYCYVQNKWAPL